MVKKRILVVDDEATMRDLLSTAFEDDGYEVVTAESAEEALEILKERSFHVQFLDLQLPGMNGLDLCREIRPNNPVAILFAMTGYASVFHLVDCREAGFDDYFVKPFDVKLLKQVTSQAFERIDRWRRGGRRGSED